MIAEFVVDEKDEDAMEQEEETIADSPLPIGPADGIPVPMADTAGAMTEDAEESKCEDGDVDVCNNGEGVMLVRDAAGGCPIGVIDRPEPDPIGAIGVLLIDGGSALASIMVGPGPLEATGGIKVDILTGACIGAGAVAAKDGFDDELATVIATLLDCERKVDVEIEALATLLTTLP